MNRFGTIGCLEHASGACVIRHREKTLVEARVFAGARVFVCFRSQRVLVCELHLTSNDFFMLDSRLVVTRRCQDHLVSRANSE